MADENDKKSVASTEEIRGFLKMDSDTPDTQEPGVQLSGAPPVDLPFMENIDQPIEHRTTKQRAEEAPKTKQPLGAEAPAHATGPIEQITMPGERKGYELYGMFIWLLRNIGPYVVIFAIGLGLYFFYFSDFTFTSLLNKDRLRIESITSGSENEDLVALQKKQAEDYRAWMGQFFFDVNDDAIISMDTDVSGNGLTNFEKYLLNLNPKVYSTRGDMGDGEAVLQNLNPWTGKPLTDEQKQLIEKYINKELISNRITAAALSRGVTKFAEYVNPDSPYYIDPRTLADARRNEQTITSPEALSNQQSYNASQSASNAASSTNTLIDESTPGRLDIPANKISVPVIWTKDVKNFDADLKRGIVHYPGTPFPGEVGTSYISGHSSGYLWDKSPYKQIFAVLGQVQNGTSFSITVKQKDGKQVIYHYVVDHRGEFAANDQAQFVSTGDSVVALSTCWPVGTTSRRLVLFGKLTQTERN